MVADTVKSSKRLRERERKTSRYEFDYRLTAAISKGESVSAVMSIACVNQNRS
ncbi:hypothetical protein HanIR_Chr12g0613981 [Helianthus annuus]|nr:hypothetical protein HanIR_Chr12g0613981 [Helianthus annuus]